MYQRNVLKNEKSKKTVEVQLRNYTTLLQKSCHIVVGLACSTYQFPHVNLQPIESSSYLLKATLYVMDEPEINGLSQPSDRNNWLKCSQNQTTGLINDTHTKERL